MQLQPTAEMTKPEPISCPRPCFSDNRCRRERLESCKLNVTPSTASAVLALQELKRGTEKSNDDTGLPFPMNQD